MWPPNAEDVCNYSYLDHTEHAALNPHDHYHHHHFPHSSVHHTECFQTLSCPSDLPVESSYYHQMPPTYQELGHTDLSPQFWCAEVDCAHERCSTKKDIPHEQSKIFDEISKECEHLLKESDCEKCNVQHEDGGEEAIPIKDLVDIVMQTVDNIKQKDSCHEETKLLSRKREQNKVAAARYRDKQKAKWQDLLNKRIAEEERRVKLKSQVSKLEEEVAVMRKKVLECAKK